MTNLNYQVLGLYTEDINRITILRGSGMNVMEIERNHFNDLIRTYGAKYDDCKQEGGPNLRLIRMDTRTERTFSYRGKSIGIQEREVWQCIEDPELTLCIYR